MSESLDIQRLLPRHFKIIELAAAGHDTKTIAETLNMAPGSVSKVLGSPFAQHELAMLRKNAQESTTLGLDHDAAMGKARSILEQASIKAAQKHIDLLDTVDPRVQLQAADKILDRVFGRGADGNRASSVINITAEQIQLLTVALKESDNGKYPANRSQPHDPQVVDEPRVVCEREGSDGPSAPASEDQSGDVLPEASLSADVV